MEAENAIHKLINDQSDEEFFDAHESFEDSTDRPFRTFTSPNKDASPVSKFFSSDPHGKFSSINKALPISEFSTEFYNSNQKNQIRNTTTRPWKLKSLKKKNKEFVEFSNLALVQELKIPQITNCLIDFSPDGRYLSIAGDDPVITIYEISRQKYPDEQYLIFDEGYLSFTAHTCAVTSLSWSFSSLFFLSSSFDGMVYKWNIGQSIPIATYKHTVEVVCIGIHPNSEDIFFSGGKDNRIRIWNSNSANVHSDLAVEGEIACGKFSPTGLLVIGLAHGFCLIITYNCFGRLLNIIQSIDCRNSRGPKSAGRKITGVDFVSESLFLVSTNDSRIRLFDTEKYEIKQKYKGLKNEHGKVFATVGLKSMHVISGSENGNVYIWNLFSKTVPKLNPLFTKKQRYKNSSYEFFSVDGAKAYSYARLAPEKIVDDVQRRCNAAQENYIVNNIIIVAKKGFLLVFYNKAPTNKRFNKMNKSFA